LIQTWISSRNREDIIQQKRFLLENLYVRDG
jgi:hypothetical protein